MGLFTSPDSLATLPVLVPNKDLHGLDIPPLRERGTFAQLLVQNIRGQPPRRLHVDDVVHILLSPTTSVRSVLQPSAVHPTAQRQFVR